jgi:hypothetical protein
MPKKHIKELAYYFDTELQKQLPISLLPNGSLVYKDFLVKELQNGNWGLFNIQTKDLINQYYLKSCALIAAKSYSSRQFKKCFEIKELDNGYWSNYSDTLIFKQNLKSVKEDRYAILETRLEESTHQSTVYKHKIYSLFKLTFV